jgi:hypothetical protein
MVGAEAAAEFPADLVDEAIEIKKRIAREKRSAVEKGRMGSE